MPVAPSHRLLAGSGQDAFPPSRGVAQPGRAPGSGPGGRRFKSSLPDHLLLWVDVLGLARLSSQKHSPLAFYCPVQKVAVAVRSANLREITCSEVLGAH